MSHTPGPWHYQGVHVWAGDDESAGAITQGGCGCCNGTRDGVYNEDDARLIAAAPDLLAALERIANSTLSQFMGPNDMAMECVHVARAAIAKATEPARPTFLGDFESGGVTT